MEEAVDYIRNSHVLANTSAHLISLDIPYRIDAERSTLTNEAKDNDAILYLDRLDAESAD